MKCRACDGEVGFDFVCSECGRQQCLFCESEVRHGECSFCGSQFSEGGELRAGPIFSLGSVTDGMAVARDFVDEDTGECFEDRSWSPVKVGS